MTVSANFATDIMKHEKVLRPFAFNLTRDREESEDLIQDTFYRAISNADKFHEGSNIKAWLLTIMRNIFINNYRKSRKRNTVTDTSENQYLLNSTKKIEKNGSERSFLAKDIEKVMSKVSSDFTVPFMMYFNGFKYQEIAEKLDLPLGTVKSRIFFARKELQNHLQAMGIENSAS